MNRADFGRVIAEFWADGPDSETPPGHWNVLANYVSNQTTTVKCIGGTGPIVNDLEWDVKMYFGLNASVHDAAVAAWNHKGIYDSARPISLIRYMGIPLKCGTSSAAFFVALGRMHWLAVPAAQKRRCAYLNDGLFLRV